MTRLPPRKEASLRWCSDSLVVIIILWSGVSKKASEGERSTNYSSRVEIQGSLKVLRGR